ncbi:MAG: ADP-ribosylglycohydrolase family protein [Treponema sp.]|nr:ADP-ribosylglycohydrolase family protein [Treponema sp.]
MNSIYNDELRDRFRGCLLGLAAGDAVGTSVEFSSRGSFAPITDMVGGGPFRLKPGEWTDDTSMALCLATSLVECYGFNAHDQMEWYTRWAETGYLSSTGTCFDIGTTVRAALLRFKKTNNPMSGSDDPHTAGNGSIMRLAPIPLYYFPDINATEQYGAESSRTTHGAAECLDACRLFARILNRALSGRPKEEILLGDRSAFSGAQKIMAIADGAYLEKTAASIRGSGYVVESLEAALWCFAQTSSYKDAILMATNLGDDADTTAAVCGQLAGAYYGVQGIPEAWREKLAMYREITDLADRLFEASRSRKT